MILESKLLTLLNEVLNQNAKLRKGGTQASYFCCFCNHYKRKLEINLETGQWHCWVCHSKGSYLGSLLSKLNAPQQYRDRAFELTKDVRLVRKNNVILDDKIPELPTEFRSLAFPPKLSSNFADDNQNYRLTLNYLKKRKITFEDICRYNIGYCTDGEYRDCVIIPSYDAQGKLNYFSARMIFKNSFFKYKNAPYCKNIIGFESFIDFSKPVTLVEGVFDAMACRINTIPLFGTSIPLAVKEALVINKTPRINLVLDNDALPQILEAAIELQKWGLSINVVPLELKDPSEMGFYAVNELIEKSKRFDFEDKLFLKLLTK